MASFMLRDSAMTALLQRMPQQGLGRTSWTSDHGPALKHSDVVCRPKTFQLLNVVVVRLEISWSDWRLLHANALRFGRPTLHIERERPWTLAGSPPGGVANLEASYWAPGSAPASPGPAARADNPNLDP